LHTKRLINLKIVGSTFGTGRGGAIAPRLATRLCPRIP